MVTDGSGLSSEDRTFIQVKNVEVTTPLGNDSHRRGATIDIRGSVRGGAQFDHYMIEYGAGYNPTEWHTAGITLANGGTLPVIQGFPGQVGHYRPGWARHLRVAGRRHEHLGNERRDG